MPSWAALDFDGSNDEARTPYDLTAYSVVTVSLWAKWPADNLSGIPVIEFGRSDTGQSWNAFGGFAIEANGDGTTGGSGTGAAAGSALVFCGDNAGGFGRTRGRYYPKPTANAWHHFVAVLDRTDSFGVSAFYVDGVAQSQSFGTYSEGGSSLSLTTFGNGSFQMMSRLNGNYHTIGTIDDVRLYNRALSSQESQSLGLSRCRLNNTDGLIGYWRMDDGGEASTGVTVRDFSGGGNTITLINGPIWRPSTFINYP